MSRSVITSKNWKTRFMWLLFSLLILVFFLFFPSSKNYLSSLSVHILIETLSITISIMIFYFGWNTYASEQPGNMLIFSVMFLPIGLIDFAHILSYDGMPDFFTANNPHKATLFWQSARFITAIGLLLFLVKYVKPFVTALARRVLLFLALVFTALIYWTIIRYEHDLPLTFMDGEGLTLYNVLAEYIILAIHIINIVWIVSRRSKHVKFVKYNFKYAVTALTLLAVSELTFILFGNAHDLMNTLGHVFRILGFVYIFRAVFHENVKDSLTRLIRSEQVLRDHNERMHTILKNIYDAVIITDRNGDIQFMNHNAELWTGWKFSDIDNQKLDAIFKLQISTNLLKDIINDSKSKPGIIQDKLVTHQGTVLDVEYAITVIMSSSGVYSVVIVFRDITERVSSEKYKDRLLAILDSATDYISISDVDGRTVFYNNAALELLELSDQMNLQDRIVANNHPEESTRQILMEAFPIAREKGKWKGESILLSRSGKHIPLSMVIVSHKNENDEVEYFSTISRDITDWKLSAEQNILTSRVFESIQEGVMVTDRHQKIVFVNRAFTELTGYSFEDVYQKSPKVLSSGWHNSEFYDAMWSTIHATGTWRGELWNKKYDGTLILEELSISQVTDQKGTITHYVGVFQDITLRKELEAKIHYQAYHDILTGLPNRILLKDRMSQAIHYAERNKQKIGLIYLDVDRFKQINDHFGHHIGDRLLQLIAERLKKNLRASDTIARIGGDEFIILLPNMHSHDYCLQLADKIKNEIVKPFYIESHELYISCSMGISMYPDNATDAEQLLILADNALYKVKQEGRNNFQLYNNLNMPANDAFSLENSLRNAIHLNEFTIYYQPIVQTNNHTLLGAEALIRWNHQTKGLISPAEFIPLAEETGMILMIDRWVLRQACLRMKQWHDQGFHDLSISVNLSMLQFQQADLVKSVQLILMETGLPPSSLILEITERTMMHNPDLSIMIMQQLRDLGVRISLDDFGIGYSSFTYLKKLPISMLKIDKSFIKDITENPRDLSIVNVLINMAHILDLKVVAEGIETKEQLLLLTENMCDYIQGYYFNQPLSSDKFASLYLE